MNAHAPTLHDRITRNFSRVMFVACVGCAGLMIAVLGLVAGYVAIRGYQSLNVTFFSDLPTGDSNAPGGMRHSIVGTAILVGVASLAGIPMGMLTGIYLSEYSTERVLAVPVKFICDVLSGVPSIVVGILGYELLVVPLGHYNGWAGAMALAFIMVPIVARTTEEMLRLVPRSYREASIALGATKARTILRVVVPSATGSIVTGVMLAIARVAGETAPLLFTALYSRFMPVVFDGPIPRVELNQPFPSLTVQIYNYATSPSDAQKQVAWAGVVVLVSLIFVINLVVRRFARSVSRAA